LITLFGGENFDSVRNAARQFVFRGIVEVIAGMGCSARFIACCRSPSAGLAVY